MNDPDEIRYEEILRHLADPDPDGPVARALARHDPAGALARRRAALAQDLLRAFEAGPPPELTERQRALGREVFRAGAPAPRRTLAARFADALGVVADWVRDTAPAPAPGMRGAAQAGRRLYRAGAWEVEVARMHHDSLVGHVTAPESERDKLRGATCLLLGARELVETEVHANGDFRFGSSPADLQLLLIEGDDLRILVPDLPAVGAS
ncbi:MAG: hypothetical protein AAF682_02940 [Planctomycetota bacterium]